jgi:hypothetical protein
MTKGNEMKVRKALGLVMATPALVLALAQPSDAAADDVVTFAGTIQITPTALPQQQQLGVCFFGLAAQTCANGAESSGMAAGAGLDAGTLVAEPVDGLQAEATYVEQCAPGTGLQPVGSATLVGNAHKSLSGAWGQDVRATWVRAGLVAVIQGDAIGTALFTPAGVPACGKPVPVAVAGAVELRS